jgi:hypothetical protein
MYFSNCTIHIDNLKEMCGNCLIERTELAERNLERLRQVERKVKQMPESSRRVRALSQMDSNQQKRIKEF